MELTRKQYRINKRRTFNYWFFRHVFETIRDVVFWSLVAVSGVTLLLMLQWVGWWMQGR